MDFIMGLKDIEIIVDILKIYCLSICTYRSALKLVNVKSYRIFKNTIIYICIIFIAIIGKIAKNFFGFFYGVICIFLLLGVIFCMTTKYKIVYSMLITLISLSINYILFFVSIAISFIPNVIMKIDNNYLSLLIIISVYIIFVSVFFKMKRFKQGFSFLQNKFEDEYFSLIVLNVSTIILFFIIVLSNYKVRITGRSGFGLIIFSIIMFVTIQKSLKLYYKKKLLVKELNETKEELEKKKQEIEQLEKENLNFSKTSHSIAHKQKALEYKLNELMMKNEISSEIDIKDRINNISKELFNEITDIELSKTDIPEIDDMLKYMQAECIKNKIDFQIQLSGNIYHMVNNYISKEKLEILIADHIKNAIIAINYSDNINKSILVRLGNVDGVYSFYVYDSGVEFEIDTLLNLGKKPSTTHANNGGTGMGFMNTFDTLKEYKASIIINEYNKPCKDNYTKLIMIKFDKRNEFKISSYRSKEIKCKANANDLNIEKIENKKQLKIGTE